MSEDSSEVARIEPFFYPAAKSTPPDPIASAERLAEYLKAEPGSVGTIATDLPVFLLHVANTNPAQVDQVLQTVKVLTRNESLPLINDWDTSRPNTTFEELFHVAFKETVNDKIGGPIDVSERDSFVGASLLAGRARSFGLLNTPEIVGSLAEGLAFPNEVIYHYQGDVAEIVAIGAFIQLLGGASSLVETQPTRFAKDKILAALNDIQISQQTVIQFTKSHLNKDPLEDLTSESIVRSLRDVGWEFPGGR